MLSLWMHRKKENSTKHLTCFIAIIAKSKHFKIFRLLRYGTKLKALCSAPAHNATTTDSNLKAFSEIFLPSGSHHLLTGSLGNSVFDLFILSL